MDRIESLDPRVKIESGDETSVGDEGEQDDDGVCCQSIPSPSSIINLSSSCCSTLEFVDSLGCMD